MNRFYFSPTLLFAFMLTFFCLHAEEIVPPQTPVPTLEARCALPICDNAIFQQKRPVPVWGWSLPGAEVAVTFSDQSKKTTADKDGAWKVILNPLAADQLSSVNEAPPGRTLKILTRKDGNEATKTIANILVGEVWLCSGQSNMAAPLGRAPYPPDSLQQAHYPALRNLVTEWTPSSPTTAGKFSRVAFSFARELQAKLMVPIGLMSASVGGTMIESWISDPWVDEKGVPVPTKYRHYETKIAPLAGYAMRGTIWYQGEGNVKDGRNYLPKMQKLISGWRKVWAQGDFPFYFVQLAGIGESPADKPEGGDGRAEIRNAQVEALTIPNTGMAVTIDIGDRKEHPINKHDIGLRLARLALHHDYGQKELVPSGPLYKSHKIEGSTIRVSFHHAQNDLMLAKKEGYQAPEPTPDAPMPWLSLQVKDGTWHWAEGKIDGSDLLVSSKDVKEPMAVRYAYTNYPLGCNLYNKDALPASPFTTCGY